jgi:DNA-binding LytR/AlgR family response regulator
MPEVSGLDVARRLGGAGPLVVFQTAYDEYALAAFEREALDFIVKPVTSERLSQSFDRARRRLAERADRPMMPAMTEAVAARLEAALGRGERRPPPRRLLVRHQSGHRLIPVASVDRFVAADGVVSAVVSGAEHLTDDSLDALETRLSTAFVRTTRSDLIAIDRVDRITSNGDGSATITMKDGSHWRVSRRRAKPVRDALQR